MITNVLPAMTRSAARRMLLLLPWLVPAVVFATEPAKEQPAPKPAACQLILEGKHIERLTLADERGRLVKFTHPEPSVSLPAGRYQMREIVVEGGYFAQLRFDLPSEIDRNQLTLSPDKPCDPKIGAPLKPHLIVNRSGNLLTLDCRRLCDGDGREYSSRGGALPPQYAIYQGDREIASGTIKYG